VNDPGQLPLGSPAEPGYPLDSRYFGVPRAVRTLADGRVVSYLRRRVVPPPAAGGSGTERIVRSYERLDTIAAETWGNSRLWWRIADANRAVDPDDLLEQGRALVLPDPSTGSAAGDGGAR
jgi:hypothetical protein